MAIFHIQRRKKEKDYTSLRRQDSGRGSHGFDREKDHVVSTGKRITLFRPGKGSPCFEEHAVSTGERITLLRTGKGSRQDHGVFSGQE